MKKIFWWRNHVYLGDDWYHILIKRRRFRKDKFKIKIGDGS